MGNVVYKGGPRYKDKTIATWCGLMYRKMSKRNNKRNHGQIPFNKIEFIKWMHEQKNIYTIFEQWKDSEYNSDFKPSIDRKDNDKGYEFSNIRLITWKENREKAYKDMRSGKINIWKNRK